MFTCTKRIEISGFNFEIGQQINEEKFYRLPNFIKLSFKRIMDNNSSFKESIIEIEKEEITEEDTVELTTEMENIPDEILNDEE